MTAWEKLTIDTPEQIALEFTLAGVGSRFLALALDTVIQVSLVVLLYIVAVALLIGRVGDGMWALAIVVLLGFMLFYGYFAAFEWLWRGQTPGKRLLGLRVISASGHPMTPYQAAVRNLLRIVDQIPGLYGVGIVSVLLTERSQRLGDLVAGTVVVREDATTRQPLDADAPRTGRETLRATRLADAELALVERFLQRRSDLEGNVREQTARQIATRIRERLGLPPGGEGEDEALLERVALEYRSGGR